MYETGNPVPSNKLEDLADDGLTLDELVVKTEGTTTDRLGRTRRVFQQILMDMGFQPLSGSFQTGATVTARNQALYDEVSHVFYAWGGTLPKVVLAGSTPATAGGIGAGAWSDKTDLTLRSEIGSYGLFVIEKSLGIDPGKLHLWVEGATSLATEYYLYTPNGKIYTGYAGVMPSVPTTTWFRCIPFGNSLLRQALGSYTGIVSDPSKWSDDDGTRLYIMPTDVVTTGTGGALKIFGDPYHIDDQNYRDLGIYFSQNQSGESGNYGNGVFWINSKTNGSYAGSNPPIGFSFQDGTYRAGYYVLAPHATLGKYTIHVVGYSHSEAVNSGRRTRQFINGDTVFQGRTALSGSAVEGIRWKNSGGTYGNIFGFSAVDNAAYLGSTTNPDDATGASDNLVRQVKQYSDLTLDNAGNYATGYVYDSTNHIQRRVGAQGLTQDAVSSGTTIDVSRKNAVKLSHASATNVTGFTSMKEGQEVTLIFDTALVTLVHSSTFIMKGNANITPAANDVIKLFVATTGGIMRAIQIE